MLLRSFMMEEIQIERMKLDHVEELSKAHDLWTTYRKSLILEKYS
jgi:hypothetical protein